MKHTTKASVLGLLVLMAFSVSGAAITANATESGSVDVTVQSSVAVDVHPTNLAYTTASVGSQVTASDSGYTSVDLLNTGSEYIDRIWVDVTKPNGDPYGTGSASAYNAGNFFQIKPDNASALLSGDADTYHYVNRVEYMYNASNNNQVPSYVQFTGGKVNGKSYDAEDQGIFVGRFRTGDKAYLFLIASGSPGSSTCDSTGSGQAVLRVANTAQTDGQVGTTDFTDSNSGAWTEYNISGQAGSWGVTTGVPAGQSGVTLQVNGEIREYDVLAQCDPSSGQARVIRTRYNVKAGDATDLTTSGSRAQFLLAGDTPTTQLPPGSSVTFDTAVEIPRGVAAGSVSTGDITFRISSDVTTSTT